MHGVVREHDIERSVREREGLVRVRNPERASLGAAVTGRSDRVRVVVDTRRLGVKLVREKGRDSAGTARHVEEQLATRSEPRRELTGLGCLKPSGLTEVLVVRLGADPRLDV